MFSDFGSVGQSEKKQKTKKVDKESGTIITTVYNLRIIIFLFENITLSTIYKIYVNQEYNLKYFVLSSACSYEKEIFFSGPIIVGSV